MHQNDRKMAGQNSRGPFFEEGDGAYFHGLSSSLAARQAHGAVEHVSTRWLVAGEEQQLVMPQLREVVPP